MRRLRTVLLVCCTFLGTFWLNESVRAQGTMAASRPTSAGTSMRFLYHADPKFLAGLARHGLLHDYGLRVHNTGLQTQAFGPKWTDAPLLAQARASDLPYYIDRICGGMPFQSLEGIEQLSESLKDDPNFLGFQVHEWGNAPVADYTRIRTLLIDKGLPFDREHFDAYKGRIQPPYFGGGDFDTYHDIFRPLNTVADVDQYLQDFMAKYVRRTHGQVMSVNGYIQLYHAAFRLGAKNVMAEIGNQVPLTAVQIACARGAARQAGKPFGVYYEPWGGRPFGCPCALSWSPWFHDSGLNPDEWKDQPNIGEGFGSSLSLMRRLMWYSLLSGASWYAEEWGAENYFSNWDDYPLTDYGRVVKTFREEAAGLGRIEPIVPAAIVLPAHTVGVDVKYAGGRQETLHGLVEPDAFHKRFRQFTAEVLAGRPDRTYDESNNLTASPWIGCFDVLSADASEDVLARYGVLVYFDSEQAGKRQAQPGQQRIVYTGQPQEVQALTSALADRLPARVEGQVGCAWARSGDRLYLGLFNNLGVTKTRGPEKLDPNAAQAVAIKGLRLRAERVAGDALDIRQTQGSTSLSIPPGSCTILELIEP